jgi:hypothetical protein
VIPAVWSWERADADEVHLRRDGVTVGCIVPQGGGFRPIGRDGELLTKGDDLEAARKTLLAKMRAPMDLAIPEWSPTPPAPDVDALVAAAVAAERERCARVCERIAAENMTLSTEADARGHGATSMVRANAAGQLTGAAMDIRSGK